MTEEILEMRIDSLEDQVESLQKKLEIATKALKDAIRDYEINGPCEEDCVGFYMRGILRKALKEMEELE